jgi:hypothetical protein
MPQIKTAQTSRNLDPVTQGQYRFFDTNRNGWKAFWEEMGGDLDKILKWAKDVNIEFPEEWYTGLHQFLFGLSSGDPKLLKQAAKVRTFCEFLAEVAENHIEDPKPCEWYINKGTTPNKFQSMLQRAAEIEVEENAREYINARVPELGSKFYDEYLLSLTGYKEELKVAASRLNKKAYRIEQRYLPTKFKSGAKIRHLLHPEIELTTIGQMKDKSVVAKRNTGALSYIKDVWNLQTV